MKSKKTLFRVIIGLFLIPLLILVLANSVDRSLSPTTQAYLEQSYNAPPKAVKSFKYLLGFFLGPKEKSTSLATLKYDQLKQDGRLEISFLKRTNHTLIPISEFPIKCTKTHYCSAIELKNNIETVNTTISANTLLLDRYDTLMKLGGYGIDFQPAWITLDYIVKLWGLTKVNYLKINLLASQGDLRQVITSIGDFNRFCIESLAYPKSLLETMLLLHMLQSNRDFYKALSAEFPAISALTNTHFLESFQLPYEFETLKNSSASYEISATSTIINTLFQTQEVSDLTTGGLGYIPHILHPLFLKRNATLNLHSDFWFQSFNDKCIKSLTKCSKYHGKIKYSILDYIYNPAGKFLTKILSSNVSNQLRKMYGKVLILRTPI